MEEEANTSALGGLDRHARIAADPVDRLLEQQRSAYRYRRSQSRGVLTPLGQQYEIISGPVDIEAPRRAQGELRRRGARSIRRTDRVRSGGPSRVDTASVVDVEDSGNHMGSKNHTGNDVTSVDHMVAELPVRAKDVEELRRFPRELLQSSEDRVRSIRIGVDTMSHSYSDGEQSCGIDYRYDLMFLPQLCRAPFCRCTPEGIEATKCTCVEQARIGRQPFPCEGRQSRNQGSPTPS